MDSAPYLLDDSSVDGFRREPTTPISEDDTALAIMRMLGRNNIDEAYSLLRQLSSIKIAEILSKRIDLGGNKYTTPFVAGICHKDLNVANQMLRISGLTLAPRDFRDLLLRPIFIKYPTDQEIPFKIIMKRRGLGVTSEGLDILPAISMEKRIDGMIKGIDVIRDGKIFKEDLLTMAINSNNPARYIDYLFKDIDSKEKIKLLTRGGFDSFPNPLIEIGEKGNFSAVANLLYGLSTLERLGVINDRFIISEGRINSAMVYSLMENKGRFRESLLDGLRPQDKEDAMATAIATMRSYGIAIDFQNSKCAVRYPAATTIQPDRSIPATTTQPGGSMELLVAQDVTPVSFSKRSCAIL